MPLILNPFPTTLVWQKPKQCLIGLQWGTVWIPNHLSHMFQMRFDTLHLTNRCFTLSLLLLHKQHREFCRCIPTLLSLSFVGNLSWNALHPQIKKDGVLFIFHILWNTLLALSYSPNAILLYASLTQYMPSQVSPHSHISFTSLLGLHCCIFPISSSTKLFFHSNHSLLHLKFHTHSKSSNLLPDKDFAYFDLSWNIAWKCFFKRFFTHLVIFPK